MALNLQQPITQTYLTVIACKYQYERALIDITYTELKHYLENMVFLSGLLSSYSFLTLAI